MSARRKKENPTVYVIWISLLEKHMSLVTSFVFVFFKYCKWKHNNHLHQG